MLVWKNGMYNMIVKYWNTETLSEEEYICNKITHEFDDEGNALLKLQRVIESQIIYAFNLISILPNQDY